MAIARPVSALLTQVIDAHGGLARWNENEKVDATIVSGGGFFPLKGVVQDSEPRRMTVWLHEQRSSVLPFGAPDQLTMLTPSRIAIQKLDGTVVAERRDPRDSFVGHQMSSQWDALHLGYFNGEALWTYFTTPFLLTMEGVVVEETEPWSEGDETWRVLRATSRGQSIRTVWFKTSSLIMTSDCGATITASILQAVSPHRNSLPTTSWRTAFIYLPNGAPTRAARDAGRSWTC